MGQIRTEWDDEREVVAQRVEYLAALTDDSYRKTDLTEVLDAPRSTVDRAVRQLKEHGLVKREDGEFTTTIAGELAYKRYTQYIEFSENLFEAKKILNAIPNDSDSEIPFALFEGANVSVPEPHMPERPVLDPKGMVAESPYMDGLAPVAMSAFTDIIQDLLMEGDHEFEVVATQQVFDTLQTALNGDFEVISEFEDEFNLYVTDEEIPYALWFVEPDGEEHLGMTVYNDTGVVGSIRTANPAAVEWGRQQYKEFKDSSEHVI